MALLLACWTRSVYLAAWGEGGRERDRGEGRGGGGGGGERERERERERDAFLCSPSNIFDVRTEKPLNSAVSSI